MVGECFFYGKLIILFCIVFGLHYLCNREQDDR